VKRICALLMIGLLLLCGCTKDPNKDPTGESTVDPTGASSTAAVDYLQNVKDLARQRMPVYDEEPVIKFDPDRRIYVHVAKTDADLFMSEVLPIWVYSLDPLDPEQIQLHIDCQTAYTLEYIGDLSEYCRVKERDAKMLPDLALQEHQYYSLLGINWQEMALLKAQEHTAFDLANENLGDPEVYLAYREIHKEFQQHYEEQTAEYRSQYNNLTTENIPQFYLYYFYCRFSSPQFSELGAYDETVESAELTVANKTYPIDFGQLRLHKTCPEILSRDLTGLRDYSIVGVGLNGSTHISCYEKIEDLFSFDAERDLTITGMSQLTCGTEIEILAARVRIRGQADYFWDMQRPIEVEAGAHVDIDLYLKDARFEEFDPRIIAFYLLEYTIGQESHVCYVITSFQRSIPMWDIYLMAFEGIDMRPYHTQIVAPDNDWLNELPKEWLE